jgi:hypothetical protein
MRIGWWIVAAALVAVELGIASLILMPRVSREYTDYYVKQQARCYLDDGLPRVELGRVVGATDRYAITRCLFDSKWATLHDWGSVLNGLSGHLTFRLAGAPTGDLRLSFVAAADGRFAAPMIAVSAGNAEIGRLALSRATDRVYSVVVPHRVVADGTVDLTFGLVDAAGSPRHRRFGLLRWRIDPAEAAPVTTLLGPGYF